MKRQAENVQIFLRKDRSLRVSDGRAMNIVCIDGCLWITQDGDPRDIILRRGESFTIDRPGVALVHAFESSVISLPKGVWADLPENRNFHGLAPTSSSIGESLLLEASYAQTEPRLLQRSARGFSPDAAALRPT